MMKKRMIRMMMKVKTHKRKNKTLVDPGDLVSEKSLSRIYKILGKVGQRVIWDFNFNFNKTTTS